MEIKEKFHISLKAARVNACMTQTEAGALIGKSKESMVVLESGKQKISYEDLKTLLYAYKCPIEFIFLPSNSTKSVKKED